MIYKTCLFASYIKGNEIPKDVKHYLYQLSQCGWNIHLALSGKTYLTPDIRNFCKLNNIIPHLRPNEGLDFGAWQYLINKNVTKNSDYILLANDSVWGPIYPLQPIFHNMLNQKLDVWGLVESFEVVPHFQSWFLCLSRKAMDTSKIQRLFIQQFNKMNKAEIIRNGELKLGNILRQTPSLHYKACWSKGKHCFARDPQQINPMHLDWLSIVQSGYVPFIKKELLRDNYYGIFWLNYYHILMKNNRFFPEHYITQYLKNCSQRNVPVIPRWKRFLYLVNSYDFKTAWKYIFKAGKNTLVE
ncbi:hypothetical protein COMNV_00383 [Commensalibacter sp. Nvir]|uniref:rhamnan synthesis F family protein n=1 Tax=Commensalibacter sp. Nvir TaxID=3069817 RepID=UPI002D557141|nr:hypothetical protein COMNV_00383 [Commensalibacter sp. Nvir]